MTDPVNVPSPARVSTTEELDALPSRAVVVSSRTGEAWQRGNPAAEGWLLAGGDVGDYGTADLVRDLPVWVVSLPDRDLIAEAEARGAERALREAHAAIEDEDSDVWEDEYRQGLWKAAAIVEVRADALRARAAEVGGRA